MYNAFVAQLEERVTVNHKVDRSKLSVGVVMFSYKYWNVIHLNIYVHYLLFYLIYFSLFMVLFRILE